MPSSFSRCMSAVFVGQRLVPSGRFSKASLTGAKTVNGPLPCKVSTKPAACTAATSVVWALELTAFSTIFFFGNMASPPTITVFWAFRIVAPKTSARQALLNSNFIVDVF